MCCRTVSTVCSSVPSTTTRCPTLLTYGVSRKRCARNVQTKFNKYTVSAKSPLAFLLQTVFIYRLSTRSGAIQTNVRVNFQIKINSNSAGFLVQHNTLSLSLNKCKAFNFVVSEKFFFVRMFRRDVSSFRSCETST